MKNFILNIVLWCATGILNPTLVVAQVPLEDSLKCWESLRSYQGPQRSFTLDGDSKTVVVAAQNKSGSEGFYLFVNSKVFFLPLPKTPTSINPGGSAIYRLKIITEKRDFYLTVSIEKGGALLNASLSLNRFDAELSDSQAKYIGFLPSTLEKLYQEKKPVAAGTYANEILANTLVEEIKIMPTTFAEIINMMKKDGDPGQRAVDRVIGALNGCSGMKYQAVIDEITEAKIEISQIYTPSGG